MRILTLVLLLSASFMVQAYHVVPQSKSEIQTLQAKAEAQVVGIADTYQEAFKEARAKLPAGKYHHRVGTKKQGTTKFVVTLYYYE